MVHGEGALKPVCGDVPAGPEPPDVVDQYVQSWVGVEDRGGEPAYLGLGGHIGGEGVHAGVAGLARDRRGGCLGARGVPAGDADASAKRGQAYCGGSADAAGTAGDQGGRARHRAG